MSLSQLSLYDVILFSIFLQIYVVKCVVFWVTAFLGCVTYVLRQTFDSSYKCTSYITHG